MEVGDTVRIKANVPTFGGRVGRLEKLSPEWQELRYHVAIDAAGVKDIPVRFREYELEPFSEKDETEKIKSVLKRYDLWDYIPWTLCIILMLVIIFAL